MRKCLNRLIFKPFRHFFCGLSSKQPQFGIRRRTPTDHDLERSSRKVSEWTAGKKWV